MAFAISAYFPLGFYQGSDSGSRPESYPSLNRLYSALVSAAYLTFGFEKVDAEYGLTDEQIHDALNWFEDNPPQEILFPRVIRAGSRATVYRNKGNVQNKKKPKDKVSPAEAYIATAYEQYPESGMLLTWAWHENPSPEVFKTLNLLCDEVPYLGEACSVVELHAHEDYVFPAAAEDCVWTLSSDSALGSIFRKGRPLSFPRKGRLDDLKKAFVTANPAPKGKKRAASISDKEDEQNFLNEYLPLQTEGQARYIPPSAQKEDALKAPWATAFYLEIDRVDGKQGDDGKAEWRPEESELVGWAVALHRFLVKQWGPDPSLALIGKYAPGMSRPANNVSIQILDSGFKLAYAQKLRKELTGKGPGFLIMLPHDMLKSDVQKLHDVCKWTKGKTLYYAPNKPSLQLGDITIIDAEHLWKPVTEGMCRYWTLRPMAIAETRPIPSPKHNRKWGVQEAICLALGHVWRDRYAPKANQGGQAKASREERYWNFVDAVKAKTSNFRIFDWRAVYRVNMADYVHHTDSSNVLHGMQALIAISDAADSLDCAAMAIGQSRHLGGGFLVPVDFDLSALQPDENFGKGVPAWLK